MIEGGLIVTEVQNVSQKLLVPSSERYSLVQVSFDLTNRLRVDPSDMC